MKFLIVTLFVVSAFGVLSAQSTAWQPSPGHTQVPIWLGAVPDSQPVTGPEISTTREQYHLVAGKPWTYVERVSQPTITVYSPAGKNTGTAVVVFPGGGYWIFWVPISDEEYKKMDNYKSLGTTDPIPEIRQRRRILSCHFLNNPTPTPDQIAKALLEIEQEDARQVQEREAAIRIIRAKKRDQRNREILGF
jgi:hypothetical protein